MRVQEEHRQLDINLQLLPERGGQLLGVPGPVHPALPPPRPGRRAVGPVAHLRSTALVQYDTGGGAHHDRRVPPQAAQQAAHRAQTPGQLVIKPVSRLQQGVSRTKHDDCSP